MLMYGSYMTGARLKWKRLFFWYTLSYFDPMPNYQLPFSRVSTFELLPIIFDVVKSKKLKSISSTFSTTSIACNAPF